MQTGSGLADSIVDVEVAEVYGAYASFCALASSLGKRDLAHQLVLCEPLSIAGEAPMIAAGIASAASLCIEPSAAAVRHSIRSGAIDFTVNNLDEALRALKNEVRKGLSIAVCLEGEPSQILVQMVDRGVQPDVLCVGVPADAALAPFVERGSRVVDVRGTDFEAGFAETRWRVSTLPGQWLPRIDEIAASVIAEGDAVRREWLKRAPRYLGRALRMERYLPMTADEAQLFVRVLGKRVAEETWDASATIEHDGAVILSC